MALATIGSGQINFDTRVELLFPSVRLEEEKGYAFFIRAVPITTVLSLQYVNLYAYFTRGATEYQTPLLSKFFPSGRTMGFAVGVPKLSFMGNPDCSIIAQPKEFFPNSSIVRAIDVELLWDNSEEFEAKSAPLLTGI